MTLAIGDKVKYHVGIDSFPADKTNGKTFTGIVKDLTLNVPLGEKTYDRANVAIDPNDDALIEIECSQRFLYYMS